MACAATSADRRWHSSSVSITGARQGTEMHKDVAADDAQGIEQSVRQDPEMLCEKLADAVVRLERLINSYHSIIERTTSTALDSMSSKLAMPVLVSPASIHVPVSPEGIDVANPISTVPVKSSDANGPELERDQSILSVESNVKDALTIAKKNLAKYSPLFPDRESIKEKLKEQYRKRKLDRMQHQALYHSTGWAGRMASSEAFEFVSIAVVVFTAIWIALDLDVNDVESIQDSHPLFPIIDTILFIYFFAEWCIKVAALKEKRNFFKDGWLLMDTALLALMVVDFWTMIMRLFIYPDRDPPPWVHSTQVMRVLKVLRLTRMSRAVRIFRHAPELLYLVQGMAAGIRAVMYTTALLFLMLYVFGILFRITSDDFEFGVVYFASVPESILTLLQHATLLDGPSLLVHDMRNEHSILHVCLFYMVIFLTALTLMNMLIGVLCQVVLDVTAAEKEVADEFYVRGILTDVFQTIDDNGDHYVEKDEFIEGLRNQSVINALHSLDVDTVSLLESVESLFQSTPGQHEYNQRLRLDDFVDAIVQLRGERDAKFRDVVALRRSIIEHTTGTNALVQGLAENQSEIEAHQNKMIMALQKMHSQFDRCLIATQSLTKHIVGDEGHLVV